MAHKSNLRKFKTFKDWLQSDEPLVVGEGYLFELIRRGFAAAGTYMPDVVLRNPKQLQLLHEEMVHAGSDVVLSYTYYANRGMMERRGVGHELRDTNVRAHAIAKEVAVRTGSLLAGGLCNTNIMDLDAAAEAAIREMFEEQVAWAKEAGVDFIIAETLSSFLEGKVAIETCKKHDLPVAVLFNVYRTDACVTEGMSCVEACGLAEAAGADVVGLNCGRDPILMQPFMPQLRARCSGPIAAVPSCYRATGPEPCWLRACDPASGRAIYPKDIMATQCCPSEVEDFARACKDNAVRYTGLCCGNSGGLTRTLAEGLGRKTPASRYSLREELCLTNLWDA